MTPTIVAIATGPAPGGVGIIRISGPAALAAAATTWTLRAPPPPRQLVWTRFQLGGEPVDEGLAVFFPGPRSYTGEDVVELHGHGAPRLLRMLLEAILATGHARLAFPGEFTRRAFLSGRLDLTRAEAVADLVAAETEAEVRAAAAQLAGGLGVRVRDVAAAVLAARAVAEGALDFPDEAGDAEGELLPHLSAARDRVGALLAAVRRGAVVRRRPRVVLFGPVNAGKSTLFNRLVGEDRALVDDEPGTTRDPVEAVLEVEGALVALVDTAGLRDAPGRVESMGIQRTLEALAAAQLGVLVVPPFATGPAVAAWRSLAGEVPVLEVRGKADLLTQRPAGADVVSGHTGEGVDALRRAIAARVVPRTAGAVVAAGARHHECLERAAAHLATADEALRLSTLEVVAGELALAAEALAEVTGADASAELLDAVFSRFCIGK